MNYWKSREVTTHLHHHPPQSASNLNIYQNYSQKDIIIFFFRKIVFRYLVLIYSSSQSLKKNYVISNMSNHFFFLFQYIQILLKTLVDNSFHLLRAESTLITAKQVQSEHALGILYRENL